MTTQRPIKFRQENNKKWHYWGFIEDTEEMFASPLLKSGGKSYQFTNLKDKNGKEIYEGDILWNGKYSPNNGKKVVCVVENRDDEPLLSWNYFWGGWKVELDFPQKLEVIGNIYENSELLKT